MKPNRIKVHFCCLPVSLHCLSWENLRRSLLARELGNITVGSQPLWHGSENGNEAKRAEIESKVERVERLRMCGQMLGRSN